MKKILVEFRLILKFYWVNYINKKTPSAVTKSTLKEV